MLYLIHFDTPLGHAQHYLGFVENEEGLEARLAQHRAGAGANILAVCNERGIGWRVVATFDGDRNKERRIKRNGDRKRLCPDCNRELKAHKAQYDRLRRRWNRIRKEARKEVARQSGIV